MSTNQLSGIVRHKADFSGATANGVLEFASRIIVMNNSQ